HGGRSLFNRSRSPSRRTPSAGPASGAPVSNAPAPARPAPVFSISTTVGGPLVPRDSPLHLRYSEDSWFLDTAVKSMSVTPPRHIPTTCILRTAISADHLVKAFPGFDTFTLREIDGGLHSGEISLPANARADLGT
ncbi:unnamed protein product, partial [Pylaiella littoralis]